MDAKDIPKVTEVKLAGRRRQDGANPKQRIVSEDEKARRLTCVKLTMTDVRAMAAVTKPTNDATFVFDPTVICWRENVEKMSTVKFWENLQPKEEFKIMWKQARQSMIWIDSVSVKPKLKKDKKTEKSKAVELGRQTT